MDARYSHEIYSRVAGRCVKKMNQQRINYITMNLLTELINDALEGRSEELFRYTRWFGWTTALGNIDKLPSGTYGLYIMDLHNTTEGIIVFPDLITLAQLDIVARLVFAGRGVNMREFAAAAQEHDGRHSAVLAYLEYYI